MKKRILSIALVLCMLVSLVPAAALADGEALSGSCGKNLTWKLTDGTLTVSGTGEMTNYSSQFDTPWARNETITAIVVEDGVTSIGSNAFCSVYTAKSISIPEGITKIGSYAFCGCSGVKELVLPSTLTEIGEQAFYGCSGLESLTIPEKVKTIGSYAFSGCTKLKTVTVPESVTKLGAGAFYSCDALESAVLNCPVSSIEGSLFSWCRSLKSIVIPSTVKSFGWNAFEHCHSLKSVKIPVSVKSIGDMAFEYCYALTDIYYGGTEKQWNCIDLTSTTREALHGKTFHYNCAYEDVRTFTITTAAGKPKLGWRAVDGADKYWIYRSTDGKNFKYYDSTTKTSYTNKATTIGTTYYYMVKAIDKDNNDKVLNTTAVKSIQCRPAAPGISIYRTNGKPQLKWEAVNGASKYWIYRSTDGESYNYYDSTTKLSYTNTGAENGTKYYYKVKAVAVVSGKNVASAYSNSKNLLTSLGAPYPNAWSEYGCIRLVWQGGGGDADKYWIYRSTDGKNFKYYDYSENGCYEDCGAKFGVTYYYKIKAICASNSNANSVFSKTVSAKVTPDLTDISVKLVNGKPHLSWKAPILAEKYWIYRSTDGKNFKYYDCTTKTSYTNKATTAGVTYYYKIKSVIYYERQNIASDFSNTVSIKSK